MKISSSPNRRGDPILNFVCICQLEVTSHSVTKFYNKSIHRTLPVLNRHSPFFRCLLYRYDELPLVKPRSIDKINPAPGQFVLDKTSVTKLNKDEVYIYIIDTNNNIQIAPRGSAGRTGVKHTQLSGGEAVKGAGELKMNSDGTLSINDRTGRYRMQSKSALNKLQSHLSSNMNIKTNISGEEF